MSDRLRFGELLVRAGVIERDRLEGISAGLGSGDDLGEQLVRQGIIDEARLLQTIGRALNLPTVALADLNADDRALKLLPQSLCETHRVFPVELEPSRAGEHLHVAMANPTDIQAIKQITRQARRRIRPLVASARDIQNAIAVHYGGAIPQAQTAGRPASSGNGSPVDMFDFSVTDLSSIEMPGGLGDSLDDGFSTLQSALTSTPPGPAKPAPSLQSNPSLPSLRPSGSMPSNPPQRSAASLPPLHTPPSIPPRGNAFDTQRALDPNSLPPNPASGAFAPLDLSALDPGPLDLSALNPEPIQGDPLAMAPEPARLSALHQEAPRRRPPSPEPPRVPPTSMPPRPSEAQPAREAGFGMIRRKKRRSERAQRVSQAPSSQSEPGVLDRLDSDALRAGDRVVAKYLERYQRASDRPDGDVFLAALDRALRKSNSPTAQLVLVLVRQLAKQGIIDVDALLEDLLSS